MRIVSSSPLSLSMRYAWTTSSTAPSAASIAIHDAILAEDYVGIIENQRSTLERDATALPLVDPVLFAVPLKSHRYTVLTLIPGKSTVPVGPTASESHFGYGCVLFLRARILNYAVGATSTKRTKARSPFPSGRTSTKRTKARSPFPSGRTSRRQRPS